MEHDKYYCGPESLYGIVACINGIVYVPCESEFCGGVCSIGGDCACICHK